MKAYEGSRKSCADLEGVVEKEPPEKIIFYYIYIVKLPLPRPEKKI